MKKIFLPILIFAQSFVSAQTKGRTCGTKILPDEYEVWVEQTKNGLNGKHGTIQLQSNYNLPTIIHIVHSGAAIGSGDNITTAQALSQFTVLNERFNKQNADTINIPNVWKPIAANCNINFCPATIDPNGNTLAQPGVERINAVSKGWGTAPFSASYIDNTIKPQTIWDPNKYFNIWCIDLGSGLLGYATFPNPGTSGMAGIPSAYWGTTTDDGIVITYDAFGNVGNLNSSFNKGLTAVHEAGHWLGLRHIWGDASCGNDYCNDTPPASGSNSGCHTFPYSQGSCSGNAVNGEMFINYMDYSDDNCMYMFSNDQKKRMIAILNGSPMRMSLAGSTNCATGPKSITLTQPNGGDTIATCQYLIQWNSSGPISNKYNIDYSLDSGSTWNSIVSNVSITNNQYNWALPAGINSAKALIRISDFINTSVVDSSNSVLTLNTVATNTLTIINPTGGELITLPTTYTINWSASGSLTGPFSIDYSSNNGNSWNSITTIANNGSYLWTIPSIPSTTLALIRISENNNTCNATSSDSIFSIFNPNASANDECHLAIPISISANANSCSNVTVNTINATESNENSSCWIPSTLYDVWYSFTPTVTAVGINISNSNQASNIAYSLYSGTCNSLTELDCDVYNSSILSGLTTGQTYYLRVMFDNSSTTGTFDLCLYEIPVPTNDNCSGAIPLAVNTMCILTPGNTINATENFPTCSGSDDALDTWYSFTATATSIKLTLSSNGTFDAVAQVYNACNGSSIAGCIDQAYSGGTEIKLISGLTIGQTYYIRVYDYNGITGSFDICLESIAPITNDACSSAITFSMSSSFSSCSYTSANTYGASHSQANSSCWSNSNDDDVWYQFVATHTGGEFFFSNLSSTQGDAGWTVFSNTCNSLTVVDCGGNPYFDNIVSGLTIGQTYYANVFYVGQLNTGTFDFCLVGDNMLEIAENRGSEQFLVYPNPTKEILTIKHLNELENKEASLKLTSADGKEIYKNQLHANEPLLINLEGVANGLYFLTIQTGTSVYSKKIIKE
ncbi:MAG: T9SS type A sorting domain-containing protein [Bacteroidetes bacterium]|nr:T9SS type A sorting domain-containing protein [Bacteroidota bacterium]